MPEDKPESGQPYDPVKDLESSPIPMGSEDILPDNPAWIANQKKEEARLAFRTWYTNSIRSVFGNALSQIFSNVFGHTDNSIHFRVMTDHAPDDPAVGFVGKRDNFLPENSTSDALITRESIVPGSRIGVLVVYRAKGEDFEFAELDAEAKNQIRQFEAERTQYDQGLSLTSPGRRAHFELARGQFPVSSPIDLVVVGSSKLESQDFLTTPSQRPVSGLKDWNGIHDWLAEQFDAKGGDAAIAVSLVSETWQDRWVTPKHNPNTKAGIVEPVGVSEPLAELASPKTPPLSDLMSIRSAAAELGCDQTILHRAIKAHKIAVFELGDGTKTVSLTECREFYTNRRTTPGPVPRDHK